MNGGVALQVVKKESLFRMPLFRSGLVATLASAFGLSSCLSVARGKTETIEVTSDPPGAQVVVSDGQTGVTPFSIVARRDQGLVFHFSKAGYQSTDITDESLRDSTSNISNGAALAMGLVPLIGIPFLFSPGIDQATGADHAHRTTEIAAQLSPDGAVPAASPSASATPSVTPSYWMPPDALSK